MKAPFWQRWRAQGRLRGDVEIYYHTESAFTCLKDTYRIAGIIPERAELALGTLASEGLVGEGAVRLSPLVQAIDLLAFHTAAYLDESTDPAVLGRIFGLEPAGLPSDDLLRAVRRGVGGTIAAAESMAAPPRPRVAFHFSGGFHHAEPDRGSGFCVYNDIGVAIMRLRREGFAAPIAIVDLDFHQGNGNLAAFARDETVLTYDINGSIWSHVEAIANVGITLPSGTGDRDYLERLDATLLTALRAHEPALVFYVAGNDVLAGDRLGSFALSEAGVLERDRKVVEAAREVGANLVITLGGGYSDTAWSCSANLLRWLLSDVARSAPQKVYDLRAQFERISLEIDPANLHGTDASFALDPADLVPGMAGPPRLLLDYYTPQGVEYALERYGFLRKIEERGFGALRIEVDTQERDRQLVRIRGTKDGLGEHLLTELALRKRTEHAPPGIASPDEPLALLGLEWLLLQDPTRSFSLQRPPMPGQDFPGLGLAVELQELLVRVCHRLKLEGVWHRPAHYHIARVGAQHLRFVDPSRQGRFLAMRALLDGRDLAEATRWAEEGRLVTASGEKIGWEPADTIHAVSERLRDYFASDAYNQATAAAREALLAKGLRLEIPASDFRDTLSSAPD